MSRLLSLSSSMNLKNARIALSFYKALDEWGSFALSLLNSLFQIKWFWGGSIDLNLIKFFNVEILGYSDQHYLWWWVCLDKFIKFAPFFINVGNTLHSFEAVKLIHFISEYTVNSFPSVLRWRSLLNFRHSFFWFSSWHTYFNLILFKIINFHL